MTDVLKSQLAALLPRMRRFALSLTGGQEEADDVVQTACVKALGRLDQFTPGTRLDSWMFRIVQTCWLDQVRAKGRRRTAPSDELDALSDGGVGARSAEAKLELAAVRKQMAALPDDQRVVLALVAIEGLSYRETSEIVGAPIGTVMSRLSRARAKLLADLGDSTKGETS